MFNSIIEEYRKIYKSEEYDGKLCIRVICNVIFIALVLVMIPIFSWVSTNENSNIRGVLICFVALVFLLLTYIFLGKRFKSRTESRRLKLRAIIAKEGLDPSNDNIISMLIEKTRSLRNEHFAIISTSEISNLISIVGLLISLCIVPVVCFLIPDYMNNVERERIYSVIEIFIRITYICIITFISIKVITCYFGFSICYQQFESDLREIQLQNHREKPIKCECTYVTRANLPPFEEYIDEIRDIWDTHWLTNMGAKHNELEKQLCKRLDVPNISLFCNGHMALELVIQAFGLTGEVITTPFTFASTTHAIVRNGLIPVFCDINPDDYTIDVTKIEDLITDKTSAIIPVHVYGNICDVEEIDRIAKKHNLKVIYDAAHAFGVEYKGKGIGNYGDASMFSFHATKVFNTIEGGAVAFTDEEIGKKLYNLKNFGIKDEETVDYVGANAKMNEFAAAMGLCNLRNLDEEIDKRKKVFELYDERLSAIKGIITPKKQADIKANFAYYPIIVNQEEYGHSRDDIHNALAEKGIHARKYFYPLTCEFGCYKDSISIANLSVAKKIASSVLTLPMFGDINQSVVDDICKTIENI